MNRRQMPHALRLANLIGQQLILRDQWMGHARRSRNTTGGAATNRLVITRWVRMARASNRVMIQFQRQLSAELAANGIRAAA